MLAAFFSSWINPYFQPPVSTNDRFTLALVTETFIASINHRVRSVGRSKGLSELTLALRFIKAWSILPTSKISFMRTMRLQENKCGKPTYRVVDIKTPWFMTTLSGCKVWRASMRWMPVRERSRKPTRLISQRSFSLVLSPFKAIICLPCRARILIRTKSSVRQRCFVFKGIHRHLNGRYRWCRVGLGK